jgi:D-glutamate cyclase
MDVGQWMDCINDRIHKLESVIGTDAGGRGMQALIVPGDLRKAAAALSDAAAPLPYTNSTTVIVSGFPCCVDSVPPTETDGPPGTMAIARAALALGHAVIVVTDDCNRAGFAAASESLRIELETFPASFSHEDETRFQGIVSRCNVLIACERAGPSKDGNCYTMRGIDMTARGLIAPLHRFVTERRSDTPFIAIGDGGNELGMGKVIDAIRLHIAQGDRIGCVVAADYLIAASVSNWGGYALAAAVALIRAHTELRENAALPSSCIHHETAQLVIEKWVQKCLPNEGQETELLERCVAAGCRDGVTGRLEATVDGMSLATSLQCLCEIRTAALGCEP